MKIEYLFSRNKQFGSRLIAWAAGYEKTGLMKNPSHVAVLMNDSWVLESTLTSGVRVVPYSAWKKINEELYRIPCANEYLESRGVMEAALKVWGKKYDWKGIMYFALSYMRLIMFNTPLPSKNPWQRKSHYFCTEYVGLLTDEDYSMVSPARLCARWLIQETK